MTREDFSEVGQASRDVKGVREESVTQVERAAHSKPPEWLQSCSKVGVLGADRVRWVTKVSSRIGHLLWDRHPSCLQVGKETKAVQGRALRNVPLFRGICILLQLCVLKLNWSLHLGS